MLVIANGAQKSGSTWMFNIVNEMHPFAEVPKQFILDPNNPNPEIRYDRLADMLRELDYHSNDYLIKNHFSTSEQRDLILQFPDVFVLDIDRSLKDVVVSGYYHVAKNTQNTQSFDHYYWTDGRFLADLVRKHHAVWLQAPESKVLMVSYERLLNCFDDEVTRIAEFLRFNLSCEDLKRISRLTSMSKLREKYDDKGEIKFFRKGVVGDWVNHISGQSLRDIEAIEMSGVIGLRFFRRNYARFRKYLYKFVGD